MKPERQIHFRSFGADSQVMDESNYSTSRMLSPSCTSRTRGYRKPVIIFTEWTWVCPDSERSPEICLQWVGFVPTSYRWASVLPLSHRNSLNSVVCFLQINDRRPVWYDATNTVRVFFSMEVRTGFFLFLASWTVDIHTTQHVGHIWSLGLRNHKCFNNSLCRYSRSKLKIKCKLNWYEVYDWPV